MNKRFYLLAAAFLAAAVVFAACGKNEYKARAIQEDTDRCAHCNMAVADDAHATQVVAKDGRVFVFDDVGCMYVWMADHGDDVGAAFVRDYNGLHWVKYEQAYYVYDESIKTPMAYGVLSFEKKADAEAFIAEHGSGTLMTADELSGHSWETHGDHDHHHHDHEDGHHEHGHGEDGHGDHGHHEDTHGAEGHDEGHEHDGGEEHEAAIRTVPVA